MSNYSNYIVIINWSTNALRSWQCVDEKSLSRWLRRVINYSERNNRVNQLKCLGAPRPANWRCTCFARSEVRKATSSNYYIINYRFLADKRFGNTIVIVILALLSCLLHRDPPAAPCIFVNSIISCYTRSRWDNAHFCGPTFGGKIMSSTWIQHPPQRLLWTIL